MPKKLIISEQAKIAALMDRGRAIEFLFESNDFSVGDIFCGRVENILPSIDAVFVNLGSNDKMGFLHGNNVNANVGTQTPLFKRVFPKQKLLIQVVKEPTGNKGPRVSTDISLIGKYFVLTTEHENIILSRRISDPSERARLKAIVTLLKPPTGFGVIVRTEAANANELELEADFEELYLNKYKNLLDEYESRRRPGLIMRDAENMTMRVVRDIYHESIDEIAVDSEEAAAQIKQYLKFWEERRLKIVVNPNTTELFDEYNVTKELENSLYPRVELNTGGYILIEPTEAMTVIDVNSGKFTSSASPEETVFITNIEAATEIAKQLRLRNIGGVIVIDFIDMADRYHRIRLLEHLNKLLESDPARPQIGRLSDLGLIEITRHRQERNIHESVGLICNHCDGHGIVFPVLERIKNLGVPPAKALSPAPKVPHQPQEQDNNILSELSEIILNEQEEPVSAGLLIQEGMTEDQIVKALLSEAGITKPQHNTKRPHNNEDQLVSKSQERNNNRGPRDNRDRRNNHRGPRDNREHNNRDRRNNRPQEPNRGEAHMQESIVVQPEATIAMPSSKLALKPSPKVKGTPITEHKPQVTELNAAGVLPGIFRLDD